MEWLLNRTRRNLLFLYAARGLSFYSGLLSTECAAPGFFRNESSEMMDNSHVLFKRRITEFSFLLNISETK